MGRYKQSLEDPEAFWADIGKDFHWEKKWDTLTKVLGTCASSSVGALFVGRSPF